MGGEGNLEVGVYYVIYGNHHFRNEKDSVLS